MHGLHCRFAYSALASFRMGIIMTQFGYTECRTAASVKSVDAMCDEV